MEAPIILHIDLGNQSLSDWLKQNKYIIYSELIRYAEILIKEDLELVQAIMVSNLADNIVFLIKRENVKITLDKAMDYFLSQEEFEKCAKIRDLNILIQNKKYERADSKNSK
jgi:hypothetical protein